MTYRQGLSIEKVENLRKKNSKSGMNMHYAFAKQKKNEKSLQITVFEEKKQQTLQTRSKQ